MLTTSIIIVNQTNLATAEEPSKLKIYVGPSSIPADNDIYECIFVQLQDSRSRPARALTDTTISLSSSLTSIGTVDPTVTITRGNTFAVAKFQSTFTPGSTKIAATTSGYTTVQANLITVAPVPYKLAAYGFPPVLPSDGAPYEALVVQLQDSSSNPAKAPLNGITVILSSSNSTMVAVPPSVIISGGQTQALASMTSTATGPATITAQAPDYMQAFATITAETPSTTQPTKLQMYVAPPKTLADNKGHSQIIVQLLDATGKITQQPSTPTTIQLTSSNEDVGKVQSTMEVPTGSVYATATFTTTFKAGTATITAAATDLAADTATITTIGPIPSKLVVYCAPSVLQADNQAYNVVQVQLQDSSGKPALDPDGDVTVSLFSSEPAIGAVATTLKIPYGETYATTTFASTLSPGSAAITAQASGYTTGQATMTTYAADFVPTGNTGTLQICVKDDNGQPVSDAVVSTLSQPAGMKQLLDVTDSTGYVTFPNATEGNYTINVKRQGYSSVNQTINFKTTSSVQTVFLTKTADNQLGIDPTIILLIIVAVIVVVVVIVAAYIQRRRTRARFKVPKKWEPPPPPKPRT